MRQRKGHQPPLINGTVEDVSRISELKVYLHSEVPEAKATTIMEPAIGGHRVPAVQIGT